jgi:hypothetical protein
MQFATHLKRKQMDVCPVVSRGYQFKSLWGTILLVLLLIGTAAQARAATTVSDPSTGITLSVNPSGAYSVTTQEPAWTFAGSTGSAVTILNAGAGTDGIGAYQQIAFSYADGSHRQAAIRTYQGRPVVIFEISYLALSPNASPFPTLISFPQGLYHISYDGQFSPHTFGGFGANSPWLFFDSSANAFIVSPAANFMVASMSSPGFGQISSGINSGIATLPSGFNHRTMLVVEKGINRAYDTWGHALTDLQGKVRPANDADVGLKYLGYWTDNGASYYYNYDASLGYDGTLLAVRDYLTAQGVPIGYMQVDSWWYPKGADAHWQYGGGIYTYTAHPMIFPNGLKAFQQRLGLPLITHSRWIDQYSPYRTQYRISNNVSVDPQLWDNIAGYVSDAGSVTYEQDWLDFEATAANTIDDQEAFMGDMARSCQNKHLTMQYCMPQPRHFLQGSKYSNLTTIRVTGDRFDRGKWDNFIYGSRLAGAVGIWPWSDVFNSGELGNLLLSTLSAGMVGIGDSIGSVNKNNLFKTVRGDGVIVKPDFPVAPIDASFLKDAQGGGSPMVAYASTDHAGGRAAYVFAYDRGQDKTVTFAPVTIGLSGQVYVYNFLTKTGTVISASDSFSDQLAGNFAYYVVAPIGTSGIALLGDTDKFVTRGKKRISQIADTGDVTATVVFAPNEYSLTMRGYAPSAPVASAYKGSVGVVSYDPAKKFFSFDVLPSQDGTTDIKISSPLPAGPAIPGLTGEYYASADLTNLKLVRVDSRIKFNWGGDVPDAQLAGGPFSIRWRGQIVPDYSEPYTFYTSSSSGVRLWVNGVQIINDWTLHSPALDAGTLTLHAGQKYDLVVEYYNNGASATAKLFWSSPSQPKQVIPKRSFSTVAPPGT